MPGTRVAIKKNEETQRYKDADRAVEKLRGYMPDEAQADIGRLHRFDDLGLQSH
jgi:hypothetical protein